MSQSGHAYDVVMPGKNGYLASGLSAIKFDQLKKF